MKYLFLIVISFQCTYIRCQEADSGGIVKFKIDLLNKVFGDINGKKLPSFTAKDINGKVYTEKYTDAKATFLNFWFASCAPCIQEVPHLEKLYNMFKDNADFRFYAVTFETIEVVKKFIQQHKITYPILFVADSTARRLNFGRGFPTNLILNSQGIIYVSYGVINYPDEEINEFLKPEIKKILKK